MAYEEDLIENGVDLRRLADEIAEACSGEVRSGRSDETWGIEVPYDLIISVNGKYHQFSGDAYVFISEEHFQDLEGNPGYLQNPAYFPYSFSVDFSFYFNNGETIYGSEEAAGEVLNRLDDVRFNGAWLYSAWKSDKILAIDFYGGVDGDLYVPPSDKNYRDVANEVSEFVEGVIEDFKRVYQEKAG